MATIGSGWGKYVHLTIDHNKIDATLTDFPLKIILNSDRATISDMQDDGDDIRICKTDGTILDFEKELFIHGNKLVFDGVNDYVNCGTSTALESITDNITVSAWVYVNAVVENYERIIGKGYDDDQNFALYCNTSGYVNFGVTINGSKCSSGYCTTDLRGGWHHVAGVYDGTQIKIYIDGTLENYSNASGNIDTGSLSLTIGCRSRSSSKDLFLNSLIYETRVWNVARTQTQIEDNMNTSLTGSETGLIVYLPMDEGLGTTLNDDAGSNNGTIVGAIWINNRVVFHVNVPNVSSTSDTNLRVYFKNDSASDGQNASAVWDSDYKLVMHMDDSLEDSTSNSNDGTNHGSSTYVNTKGYYAQIRDGDYIQVTSTVLSAGTTSATVEAYLSVDSNESVSYNRFVDVNNGSGADRATLYWDSDDDLYGFMVDDIGTAIITGSDPTLDTWQHYAGVIDNVNTQSKFILDGTTEGTCSGTASLSDSVVCIGTRYDTLGDDSNIDVQEVRISSIARSDAWIKATSYSLADDLITYGDEVTITVISITNTPVDTISDETGKDSCEVKFQCTNAFTQWEARATTTAQTPGQGVGLLVGSGSAGYSADTDVTFSVDDEELTGGDQTYRISIYVKIGDTWYG